MAGKGILKIGLSITLGLAALASVAIALPGPTTCLLVAASRLQQAPNEVAVFPGLGLAQQSAYSRLVEEGRGRIHQTFGKPEAKSTVVLFNDPESFWPLRLNLYGQTATIGSHSCVLVGPEGQNLNVVAHELMHAELHHRVGAWEKLWEVPAWFDEGVAMQVDYRPKYDTKAEQAWDSSYVRRFGSYRGFARGANPYAAAKKEVQELLLDLDRHTSYERLALTRAGEPFEKAME